MSETFWYFRIDLYDKLNHLVQTMAEWEQLAQQWLGSVSRWVRDPEICPEGKFKTQTGSFITCMTTTSYPHGDIRAREYVRVCVCVYECDW